MLGLVGPEGAGSRNRGWSPASRQGDTDEPTRLSEHKTRNDLPRVFAVVPSGTWPARADARGRASNEQVPPRPGNAIAPSGYDEGRLVTRPAAANPARRLGHTIWPCRGGPTAAGDPAWADSWGQPSARRWVSFGRSTTRGESIASSDGMAESLPSTSLHSAPPPSALES
jgi:hypothetical protein